VVVEPAVLDGHERLAHGRRDVGVADPRPVLTEVVPRHLDAVGGVDDGGLEVLGVLDELGGGSVKLSPRSAMRRTPTAAPTRRLPHGSTFRLRRLASSSEALAGPAARRALGSLK
jgi:hypothetical protein